MASQPAQIRITDSVALKRIIEEVKRDSDPATMYNRTYHRHNRS